LTITSVKAQELSQEDPSGFKNPIAKSQAKSSLQTDKDRSIQTISSVQQPSGKVIEKVTSKIGNTTTFVQARAMRIIRKTQEAEIKALESIQKVSDLPAHEIERAKAYYQRLLSRIKLPSTGEGIAREYLPKMDSLLTSAAFLKSITGDGRLNDLSNRLSTLQSSYHEAATIQKELTSRLQNLMDRYKGKLPIKEIQRIKQASQTAKAQIQEFKNLMENPTPKVESLIDRAVQQQGFEGFFMQHAELSKLFRSPSLNIGNNTPDPGLQTVAQLEKHIQDKFGSSGKSLLAKQQQTGQQAVSGVQADMLNTILGKGINGNTENQVNTESVKPASKRLSFATDIKSQRSNGWIPAFSEIGINVGYRLSPRFISGLGIAGRVGWGKSLNDFKVSMEGIGLRSFIDYKIKGGFYATGGFEAVYDPVPDPQSRVTSFPQWQKNGLIGIKKGFRIKNGFIKGASMKLMWNYLSYTQRGVVQPFDFRMGYDF
jgi:hypothetical protein